MKNIETLLVAGRKSKKFRLFLEVIESDVKGGWIKGEGRFLIDMNEITYIEQNRSIPEYTMIYTFEKETERVYRSKLRKKTNK